MPFMKRKAADSIISLLGKGAEMTGEITFTNGLRVEGVIKGKVRSEATLEIGPGGLVDAEVRVRRISINGEFHGVIHAADRVEIHKDGKVFGDIYSPCLIIEAGAVFDGRCNMSDEKKPASLKRDDTAIKAADPEKDK
jgi:cytoskeletal protein CcmA (bactofilin family)